MPGNVNDPIIAKVTYETLRPRRLSDIPTPIDHVPALLDEAARYNAATIRDMADALYSRRNLRQNVKALVAALDAAIAVQVCLTDMLEPTDRKTA